MPYRNDEVKDLAVATKWELAPTHEEPYRGITLPGVLMLLISLPMIFFFGLGLLMLRGLVLIEPNQSKVVLLFGHYRGTLRQTGFHWINPFRPTATCRCARATSTAPS